MSIKLKQASNTVSATKVLASQWTAASGSDGTTQPVTADIAAFLTAQSLTIDDVLAVRWTTNSNTNEPNEEPGAGVERMVHVSGTTFAPEDKSGESWWSTVFPPGGTSLGFSVAVLTVNGWFDFDTNENTAAVPSVGNAPIISGTPSLSGTETEGSTLTITPASVTGSPTPTSQYDIYDSANNLISSNVGLSYTIQSADIGKQLKVRQTSTNASGSDTADSSLTGTIASAPSGGGTGYDFGANTLAGAGGIALPSGATSISNAGGTNLVVSAGYVVPDTGGGVSSGTVTFDNAVEWTITAIANAASARTRSEIGAAFGAVSSGGTVLMRDGTYQWDYFWTRRKTLNKTLKAHNWRQVTLTADTAAVPAGITMRSTNNFTLDGIVTTSLVVAYRETGYTCANITIKNCEIARGNIDPEGDYSSSLPGGGDGIQTNSPSTNLTIENCWIHDCRTGIVVYDDGDLTIQGNLIEDCFDDCIKVANATGGTNNIYLRDNICRGVIGNGADLGNPHPDFIQFIGVNVSGVIEIDRNICVQKYSRAGPQGIFLDDLGSGGYTVKARGNIVINDQGSTTGIRIRQADTCEAYGNTVVGYNSSGAPGIFIGDDTTTGTHVYKNNVASSFSVGGSPTAANNVALGDAASPTIAYNTAFDGTDYSVTEYTDILTVYNMKTGGPLDLTVNVGAVGSGYVNFPANEPGKTATYTPGSFNFTP